MRHQGLPEKFTRLGVGEDGREYIQCTRTGDVLVQTGDDQWSHFALADEWRSRTAPEMYPALIHLQRALKEVGRHEEVERQVAALEEALQLLGELEGNIRAQMAVIREARVGAGVGA